MCIYFIFFFKYSSITTFSKYVQFNAQLCVGHQRGIYFEQLFADLEILVCMYVLPENTNAFQRILFR